MLVFGLGLSVFAIGLFCRLLFHISTYALPVATGLMAGFGALGAGIPLAVCGALGIIAALGALALGWFIVDLAPSPVVRVGIALIFAVPAGIAGYNLVAGLSGVGLSGAWRVGGGAVGGLAAAVAAAARMLRVRPGNAPDAAAATFP